MSRLRIICVDDHQLLLSRMLGYVREALPEAETVGFNSADAALEYAELFGCDILFTEIELYGRPGGLELARSIQGMNPLVNIIFTTVCSEGEYAGEVVRIRPSGYLTKVITAGDVKAALEDLLYEVGTEDRAG